MAGPLNPVAQKTKEEEEQERRRLEMEALSPTLPMEPEPQDVATAMRYAAPEPAAPDVYNMNPEEFAAQKAMEYGVPSYMTQQTFVPPEPVKKPEMSVGQIMKIMGLSLIPVVGQAYAQKDVMNYRNQMGQYQAYQEQLQAQQDAQAKMIRDQMAKDISDQADWTSMLNTAQWFAAQGYSQDDAVAYAFKWHKRDVPTQPQKAQQKPLMSKIATLTTGQTAEVFQDLQTGVVYAPSPSGPQKVPATLIKSLRNVGEEAKQQTVDEEKPQIHPVTIRHPQTGLPAPAVQIVTRDGMAKTYLNGEEIPNPVVYYKPESSGGGTPTTSPNDIQSVAEGIIAGNLNPDLQTYSFRDRTAIGAILQRHGFDAAQASLDMYATKRYMSTLNNSQTTNLRRAITFAHETLPLVKQYYQEWKKSAGVSGVKVFNKINLLKSKNLPGSAGASAAVLEATLKDFISELSQVYRGGYSPTNESLKLAEQNLKAEWNEETFNKAVSMLEKTLVIRKNSIMSNEALGVTPGSPYTPQGAGSGVIQWERGPDGKLRQKSQ